MKRATTRKRAILSIFTILLMLCVIFFAFPVFAKDYSDYTGQRIAVINGEVYRHDVVEKLGWGSELQEYSLLGDAVTALYNDRVDAVMTASVAAVAMQASGEHPDLEIILVPKEIYNDKNSAIFANSEIRDKFNEWVAEVENNGLLDEMYTRWLSGELPKSEDIPVIDTTGTNGTLVFAASTGYAPLCYIDNGRTVGLEVEIAERFAQFCGMALKVEDMSYGSILSAVKSGKADFSALFSITGDREESVYFGDNILEVTPAFIVKKDTGEAADKAYTDFIGKQFAVVTGTIYDSLSIDMFKSTNTLYFDDTGSMIEAVKSGKADACLLEFMLAKIAVQKISGIDYLSLPEDVYYSPIGAITEDALLLEQFNSFLAQIKADGTLDEINSKWIDNYDIYNPPVLPELTSNGENGTLKIITDGNFEPYLFHKDDYFTGYEVELIYLFANSIDKTVEITAVPFASLIPYIKSGKADMSFSCISITEERQKEVHFSDPYLISYMGVIYRDETQAETKNTIFSWIKDGINRNLITENRYMLVVDGLAVTLKISVLSLFFGTIIGSFVCWLLTRKNRIIKAAAKLYCGFIHGTPEVTLLMVAYYIVFGNSNIAAYFVAVAAFSLVCGASIATLLSGAIATVDIIEIEAARALGFSSVGTFVKITLPQAVRRALPAYTENIVALVKSTAIVGYIAIQDLTRATDIIRSRTFDAYFPIVFSALIYLALTTLLIVVFRLIIKRVQKGVIK